LAHFRMVRGWTFRYCAASVAVSHSVSTLKTPFRMLPNTQLFLHVLMPLGPNPLQLFPQALKLFQHFAVSLDEPLTLLRQPLHSVNDVLLAVTRHRQSVTECSMTRYVLLSVFLTPKMPKIENYSYTVKKHPEWATKNQPWTSGAPSPPSKKQVSEQVSWPFSMPFVFNVRPS